MIKHIATVGIYVEDQTKSLQFWTEIMGFEVRRNEPMGPNANWIELAPPNAESRIVIYPKMMMPNWNERKPSIVFECEDIYKTYEDLSAKGVKFLEKPNKMQWGAYARFVDIDGNEFILKG